MDLQLLLPGGQVQAQVGLSDARNRGLTGLCTSRVKQRHFKNSVFHIVRLYHYRFTFQYPAFMVWMRTFLIGSCVSTLVPACGTVLGDYETFRSMTLLEELGW